LDIISILSILDTMSAEMAKATESIKNPNEGQNITDSLHVIYQAFIRLDKYASYDDIIIEKLFSYLEPSLNQILQLSDEPLKRREVLDLRSYLNRLKTEALKLNSIPSFINQCLGTIEEIQTRLDYNLVPDKDLRPQQSEQISSLELD
jgi:hypothetical protein